MHWTKLEQRWQARAALAEGQELEAGVTFEAEPWTVPGEEPLIVRACARRGFPLDSYTQALELDATSIVLHETGRFGNFSELMGGNDARAPVGNSVHFLIGRDGNAYRLVPLNRVAPHAGDWSLRSIGIAIDNLGALQEADGGEELDRDNLYSPYGAPDVYCSKSDIGCYEVEPFQGRTYWSTWTGAQYDCLARLLKAIGRRTGIPLVIQDRHARFTPLTRLPLAQQQRFRGVTTHYQINPSRRFEMGPHLDWPRIIEQAGLAEGDCFNLPAQAGA